MIDRKLGTALRSLVRRYGFKEVDRSLREIRLSEPRLDGAPHSRRADSVQTTKKKRHTVSAQEYVAKMDHDPEKRPAVSELAKRFEEKTFLPTIGDIRNFCQVYGIDEPASKSRRSAIPRVFKCMATMSAEEVRGILDDGMFSGPSRLGPVADAIRESGRAAAFRDRRVKAG
jgi:hypothetical protein